MLRDPDDYHVYLIDMPVTVPALVSYDCDGYPSVFINSRMSHEMQLKARLHELKHIFGDDIYSDRTIQDIEGAAS